ncbi:hypothetical protein V500_00666 [Pseudogymnoascus sp. VKM F-4518 (FW-2643)]|nr:hypothetical protein V500_00666 [Pseudogymnoascus sp. VKM F-4518 (FW-2643)]
MRIITVSGASPTRAQAHPRGYEGYGTTLESGPENQVYGVSSVTRMTVRCFAILWAESRVWQIQKANISSPMGPDTGGAKLRSQLSSPMELNTRGAKLRNCGLISSPMGLDTSATFAKLQSLKSSAQ